LRRCGNANQAGNIQFAGLSYHLPYTANIRVNPGSRWKTKGNILCFWNQDVMKDIERVICAIIFAIETNTHS
jgi:hypothetical protein